MIHHPFTLLILCSQLLAVRSYSASTNQQILRFYQELQRLPFNDSKVASVENLTFTKDRARFMFRKGKFYLSEAIAGKVTGAVFLGEGRFELKPPNEIERAQVRRFLKQDSLSEAFSTAYFRFTDQTLQGSLRDLAFIKSDIPRNVPKLHERVSKFFLEERGINLASGILADLLNAESEGIFLAVLQQNRPKLNFPSYLVFALEPGAHEAVSVYQYFPHRAKKPFYTICSFHQMADYGPGDLLFPATSEKENDLLISHYAMRLELKKNGQLKAEAELTYTPPVDGLQFLTFLLYQELKVDSVKNALGDTLTFIQEKKEAGFSVILQDTVDAQTEQKLTVCYSGDALEPAVSNLLLKNKLYWYPRSGYLAPATYDLTFQYPKNWQVVSVGHKTAFWEDDHSAYSRWVEDIPSISAAFAFGYFDSTTYDGFDSGSINVFSTHHRSKGMREKIGGDVANSLYFFQNLLGTLPFEHLNVAETPGLSSQSFPGLLFLSSFTYEQELEGVMEALRGHEVAHQWWGNLIGWKSYHDQWLSESLAEYSGALITQFLLDDDDRFFEILDGWRNDLLEKGHIGVGLGLRRFGFSKRHLSESQGLEAGPIWLGRRLGAKFPVDYYLITYEKGAYVLHMLRTLMRNFKTGSDERFWDMLADYVNKFKGKRAATRDFIKVVEKHMGQNMDWFFEQWIFGTEVPTYIYSYNIAQTDDEYWVDLKVGQENVSRGFKMYIPVGIEFDGRGEEIQLLLMQESEQTFRLGPYGSAPRKVIFNEFAGVLARLKQN